MTMREQKCSQICEQMFNFSEFFFFRESTLMLIRMDVESQVNQ